MARERLSETFEQDLMQPDLIQGEYGIAREMSVEGGVVSLAGLGVAIGGYYLQRKLGGLRKLGGVTLVGAGAVAAAVGAIHAGIGIQHYLKASEREQAVQQYLSSGDY